MISTLYRKMILIIIFTFLLFFHIKDKEYNKMIALTLITGVVSYLFTKEDIYEGVDDTIQYTEEEEEVRRREWLEKHGDGVYDISFSVGDPPFLPLLSLNDLSQYGLSFNLS